VATLVVGFSVWISAPLDKASRTVVPVSAKCQSMTGDSAAARGPWIRIDVWTPASPAADEGVGARDHGRSGNPHQSNHPQRGELIPEIPVAMMGGRYRDAAVPEPGRDHDMAMTVTTMNGGQ
jgi:hypothetical protein